MTPWIYPLLTFITSFWATYFWRQNRRLRRELKAAKEVLASWGFYRNAN